jgi:NAD(P)H dehydrogenase (quinone)
MWHADPAGGDEIPIRVLVVYYSRFGAVERLAECIAEGVRRVANVSVEALEVDDRPVEELRAGEDENAMLLRRATIVNRLTSTDALIVGSPGYFGGMAAAVKRLLEDCATAAVPPMTDRSRPWRHYLFKDKVGAAFTATGTPHGGNEQTLLSLLTMFMHFGMLVVTPGQQQPILENEAAPYGATTISGPQGDCPPTPEEEEQARSLGQRVAEVTTWAVTGATAWAAERELQHRGLAS